LPSEILYNYARNSFFLFSFVEGDTLDSIPSSDFTLDSEIDMENDPPAIRVRNAIKEIEERRTAKLQHMRVIGNVTYKKPNFASELVHNVRRVNFKWQLGNKIGIFSCCCSVSFILNEKRDEILLLRGRWILFLISKFL